MDQKQLQLEIYDKDKFEPIKQLCLAQSNYGKSYMIIKYIQNLIEQHIFHPKNIVLFSKNILLDKEQQKFINYCKKKYKKFEINCYDEIDEELIMAIYESQKQIKIDQPDKCEHILLYFDDQAGESFLTQRKGILMKIYKDMRHMNISSIILIQNYFGIISPFIREQSTHFYIGQLLSGTSIKKILQQFDKCSSKLDPKQCIKIISNCHAFCIDNQDIRFLKINTRKLFGQGKLQLAIYNLFFDYLPIELLLSGDFNMQDIIKYNQ